MNRPYSHPFRSFARLPRLGLLVAAAALAASAVPPATPEVIPIWSDPAEDGVHYYHIPQLLVTRAGVLLACAEARYAHGDGENTDIVLRRSTDGGRTWSASQALARANDGGNHVLPVLVQERRTGRIFFFCAVRDEGIGDLSTTNYFRTSDDDGVIWSAPVDLTAVLAKADRAQQQAIREGRAGPEFAGESAELYGRGLFFTGPGRPIQLSAQHPTHPHRLAIPLLVIKDRNFPQRNRRGYGNALLASDDAGASWQVAGIAPIGDIAASEPSLLELPDGRLLLNSRETPGRVFLAAPARRTLTYSADGGRTWTRPVADDSGLPPYHETHSGLLRLSDPRTDPLGISRVLFSFPAGPKRTRGSLLISYDDHRSWGAPKLLVPSEFGYSNLDRLPDGTIVLIHENGNGTSSNITSRVHLVRFSLEWLTEGRDRLPIPLRILPVGDSITRGTYFARYLDGPRAGQAIGLPNPSGGGWRKLLQDQLRAARVPCDFVGELSYHAHGRDGVVDPDFDPDHHGLAGFSNRKIIDGGTVPTLPDVLAATEKETIVVPGIDAVLNRHRPDVVLLLSGANGFDAPSRDELIRLINARSRAHLFVGSILPQREPRKGWEQVEDYNASLPTIVAAQQAAGHRVTLVPMHAAVGPADLQPDGVHPNQAGERKIAAAWFRALQDAGLVPASSDLPPAPTSPTP